MALSLSDASPLAHGLRLAVAADAKLRVKVTVDREALGADDDDVAVFTASGMTSRGFVDVATALNGRAESRVDDDAALQRQLKALAAMRAGERKDVFKLNATLAPLVYLEANRFTLLDAVLFALLHDAKAVASRNDVERAQIECITRYYDHVQHVLVGAGVRGGFTMLDICADAPPPPPSKKAAKAGKDGAASGGKDKGKGKAAAKGDGNGKQQQQQQQKGGGAAGGAAGAAPAGDAAANGAGGGDKKQNKQNKQPKQPKQPKQAKAAAADEGAMSGPELFARVDIRVGVVTKAELHPANDALLVEQIDVGDEGGPRQVASGIAKYYTPEAFTGRRVLVVCNLKPAKFRGVVSNGMVMCAVRKEGDDEAVEIVEAPADTPAGERVVLAGVDAPSAPDAVIDAKPKKNRVTCWAPFAAELHTDAERRACFGDTLFSTTKGPCTAATLANAPVS